MGSCAAPSAKGDDKFITTDYLQQCPAERVRDQLSVMASPNGNLDEVHEGLLLQAVRASWLAKKNRARIDDVVDFLKNARDFGV